MVLPAFSITSLPIGSFPLTVTVTTMGYRSYKNPLNKAPLRTATGRGNFPIYLAFKQVSHKHSGFLLGVLKQVPKALRKHHPGLDQTCTWAAFEHVRIMQWTVIVV